MSEWFQRDNFLNEASKLDLAFTNDQLDQFQFFGDEIIRVNEMMNLTRVPHEDFQVRHFLDSLSVVSAGMFQDGDTVLDIGTGAGLPGIPLAIAFPNVSFTLIDSLNKRIKFLDEVIKKANIKNVKVFHRRAEDEPERFSWIVVRAVTNLETLTKYFNRLLKKDGVGIAIKGGRVEEELNILPLVLRDKLSVKEVIVPGDVEQRVNHLVVFRG